MIVTLQIERLQTLEQTGAFMEGNEAVDFTGGDWSSWYEFVRRTLVRLDYERLGKCDKGLVLRTLLGKQGLSHWPDSSLTGHRCGWIRASGTSNVHVSRRHAAPTRPIPAFGPLMSAWNRSAR